MKKSLTLLLGVLLAANVCAKDIKKVVFTTTPQMECEKCENKIKGNLRFEKGVKDIQTNMQEQTVTVTYDADKTNPEKLSKGFQKFGFKARVLKPGEKAACHGHGSCCGK